MYVVAKGAILTSRADGKDYFEGQEIDLSHLSPEEIKGIERRGQDHRKRHGTKAEGVKHD